MPYDVFLSEKFQKSLKRNCKKDNALKNNVKGALIQLEADPYFQTERITAFQGKRKIRVRKSKFRIMFCICEECRKLEEEELNNCHECEKYDDKTVIVRHIDKRDRAYATGRGRKSRF